MRMLGVDVGGTFVDIVLYDDISGEFLSTKVPSSAHNPANAVLSGIKDMDVQLKTVDRFVHGITIGTNTILERRGAPVWMLITEGFGDTLEIARTNRSELYNIKTLKPPSVVPRRNVIEVKERLDAGGKVLRSLDLSEIDNIVESLSEERPAAMAICFLHSYINRKHEEDTAQLLRKRLPDWFICTSSEVLPEMREYERFNTAALNAYIGPIIDEYLDQLETLLNDAGYKESAYLMISSGGIITVDRAKKFPIQTVLSGPAGGVAAAANLGEALSLNNMITYDMGGTSTDVCLIKDLSIPLTTEQYINQYPIRTPQIEINTVGAGGGSIAWMDDGKILKVGPRSAGAVPGPACYGYGGEEPTVTDANIILGRLSIETKLAGGSIKLNSTLADTSVFRIAKEIDLTIQKTAEGILRISVARMVSAIKQISVSRGYDPRDFVLVAFGGAGPLHAALVAEELDIKHVLIPLSPGNFSAYGALISDVRHDYVQTFLAKAENSSLSSLHAIFNKMEKVAYEVMLEENIQKKQISMNRVCGMRYVGQAWQLNVPIPKEVERIEELIDLFHEAHDQRYGYRSTDSVEFVACSLSVIGIVLKPRLPECKMDSSLKKALVARRAVFFSGEEHSTPVYNRDLLPRSDKINGPAIIEEMGAVTVVPIGWTSGVGKFGEMHLRRI